MPERQTSERTVMLSPDLPVRTESDGARIAARADAAATARASFYYPELDGLRCLAFALVFLHHSIQADALANLVTGPLKQVAIAAANFVSNGWMGVELFFVLSGFLLMSLLLKEREAFGKVNLKLFYARRILRIWPLYFTFLFAGMFMCCLLAPGTPMWKHLAWFGLFGGNFAMALGKSWVVPPMCPLWSLCVEEQFYLGLGILWLLLRGPGAILAASCLLCAASMICRHVAVAMGVGHQMYYHNFFSHADPMFVGCILAFVWMRFENKLAHRRKVGTALTVCSSATLLVLACTVRDTAMLISCGAALWAVFMLGLLCGGAGRELFRIPAVTRFGRLTYGMYVMHVFVICMYIRFTLPVANLSPVTCTLSALATLPVTLLLAGLSWKYLEGPFNDLRHKLSLSTRLTRMNK